MEYYFPEDTNISFAAEASTAVINKQATTSFTDYKEQLVQINQQSKDTPDYLYFNIRGNASTSTNPEGYLIFYGIKGWMDSVPPQIYDRALETGMFEYDEGKMNMDLDLNGHSVIGARENFFQIRGYYKKSVNSTRVLFDNKPGIYLPFDGWLIEIYSVITTGGNDNNFAFTIREHEGYTSPISQYTTDNKKFQRIIPFGKRLFRSSDGFGVRLNSTHSPNPLSPLPITDATFGFKYFRV